MQWEDQVCRTDTHLEEGRLPDHSGRPLSWKELEEESKPLSVQCSNRANLSIEEKGDNLLEPTSQD